MSDLIDRQALLAAIHEGEEPVPTDVLVQIETAPTIKPQVVANITGGLLQGASADYPVDIYALDFDDDGSDPDITIEIDDTTAWLGQTSAEVDPDFVKRVINSETLADRCERGEHNWGGEPSVGAECLHCGVQFDG